MNEQKYRALKSIISNTIFGKEGILKGEIFTADRLIEELEKHEAIEKVTMKKVYRWKHNDCILHRDGNGWRYTAELAANKIDDTTFIICRHAGLIIESEEVV